MLKRICDRCGAEIPVEQMLEQDELILRKINGKPFDLCLACQNELKEWFDNHALKITSPGITIKTCGTTPYQMIPKGFEVLQFVTRCKDCQFYLPKSIACRKLRININPDFWCQYGKKGMRCECFHDEQGKPRCWGTKEKDLCDCGGDRRKCTHYPENREGHDDKREDNAE